MNLKQISSAAEWLEKASAAHRAIYSVNRMDPATFEAVVTDAQGYAVKVPLDRETVLGALRSDRMRAREGLKQCGIALGKGDLE